MKSPILRKCINGISEPIQRGEMVFLSGRRKGKPVVYTYADADREAERRRKISVAMRRAR